MDFLYYQILAIYVILYVKIIY